ncbi:hypothetical protein CAI21_10495 [Alkalilimnicola ehrlichii]|uniref:Glycosyltransferase family 1 protein n=1 Tax=Alkalilimnicola ehrlichii TaxID=351052 RepID=A0A3E0WSZ9_9GAMM|nr:glycosyltransferase family 1 protein [Alkalilimnicola ehrlichii]RFA29189.1 hypothetical protein CAI21_10495 [Alkalilimnicola ehrlichii]RFA36100.1 hypothetical protein CAL65_11635 [Alkalilimnicola ehrlichii]
MAKISCRVIAESNSLHLQQIYTGLLMLHRAGVISLSQTVRKRPKKKVSGMSGPAGLSLIVNDRIRILYDTFDGWEIHDKAALEAADYCFKRSYCPQRAARLETAERRIYPLGLNYEVYPSGPDPFGVHRALKLEALGDKLPQTVQSLSLLGRRRQISSVENLCGVPDNEASPKALFMVRAWNPDGNRRLSPALREERRYINEMRGRCIALLRSELGPRFYGGFIHDPYAREHYPDLLLPSADVGAKGRYLQLLRDYPICIASTGLHGSIGWKFGEYVALSKAIVSEPLNYQVPGELSAGRHYLSFETPEQCVERVVELMENQARRHRMMANNFHYYHTYLRPDALVMHTLTTALCEEEHRRGSRALALSA